MTLMHDREMAAGERFEFGKNWVKFLAVLDERQIGQAEQSLRDFLDIDSLAGKTFLDVGSGSGLFSLAAIRLGAERVHSFDYDPHSVACTRELHRRYSRSVPWRFSPITQFSVVSIHQSRSGKCVDLIAAKSVDDLAGQIGYELGGVPA